MDPQTGTSQPDLLVGQIIGNYLITQKLGEGGMGAVYLAEHPTIGKKVALKVLHAEFAANADVTARFFNEAKAVNDIGHPNIVDIIDFGVIQPPGREQVVYFIMEFLGGMTLAKLIREQSPLQPERALVIALQVADALAASHKCGIVHRDLKPDNIMLTQRGRERDFVKLLDFGIAKLTGGASGSRRTRTGIVMGTPAYMSPEQCEGRGNIDHRTDIYALGIVTYEMLTGRVPFIGEGYGEILVQHLTQPPTPPSQFRMINPHVEAVVMKALEKRAELRYPTMDEFIRALTDPVGYVEVNGGLGGFLHRQLAASDAPLPPARPTPGSFAAPQYPTPVPGHMTPHGVVAGPSAPTVATMSGHPARRSKAGLIIAGLVIAGAVAVTAVVLARGGGGDDTKPVAQIDASQPVAMVDAQVASPPVTIDASIEAPIDAPTAVAVGSGSGSAKPPVEPPKTITVRIESAVKGDVVFNGKKIGETNEPFEFPYGTAKVKVKIVANGYTTVDYAFEPKQQVDGKVELRKKGNVIVTPGRGSGSSVTQPPTGSNTASTPPGGGSGSGSGTPGRGSSHTGLKKPGE